METTEITASDPREAAHVIAADALARDKTPCPPYALPDGLTVLIDWKAEYRTPAPGIDASWIHRGTQVDVHGHGLTFGVSGVGDRGRPDLVDAIARSIDELRAYHTRTAATEVRQDQWRRALSAAAQRVAGDQPGGWREREAGGDRWTAMEQAKSARDRVVQKALGEGLLPREEVVEIIGSEADVARVEASMEPEEHLGTVPLLLDTEAVAARLGVKPATVRRYRHEGRLPDADVTVSDRPAWLMETIEQHVREGRPGRGARTDLANHI